MTDAVCSLRHLGYMGFPPYCSYHLSLSTGDYGTGSDLGIREYDEVKSHSQHEGRTSLNQETRSSPRLDLGSSGIRRSRRKRTKTFGMHSRRQIKSVFEMYKGRRA
jgi:hypothetical protein